MEKVGQHADDFRDNYGRLCAELQACQRELMERGADLTHVAGALNVLARRFEREGARAFYVDLLRSAANDAAALAAAE